MCEGLLLCVPNARIIRIDDLQVCDLLCIYRKL